ncbi:MAG: GAF domain-containing protein [Pleurocapsa minor GSE-CHR-MK-17-07R]|jgi:PAS domain S-box-containing protein|nr:GAF domain-containing protein [Pleurocapsa minor GSE-CHR-MK 17-07R]
MAAEFPPPTLALSRLRITVEELSAALQRHEGIASLRDIHLPEGVLSALTTLHNDIGKLTEVLNTDNTEIEQLRSLATTAAAINSSLDVDSVLSQSMDELIALTGAERGFILLKDRKSGKLEFRISRGLNDSELREDEVSRTILRQVLTTGEPILTDNAMQDLRLSESDTVARFVLRSIACVPLTFRDRGSSRERVEGALYADNKYREAVFSSRELNLLTAFANQASVAIDNAMLFEQVQETLAEIGRAREIIENVFMSIGSGVITTNAEGHITLINRAASTILNAPAESTVGHTLPQVLPDLNQTLSEPMRAVSTEGKRTMLESRTEVSGRGRIVLNLRLSPIRTSGGDTQGVAMVLDDLTEERERDETLGLIRRYLPPGMIDNIHQIADLAMGGERREVTCVFMSVCDLADFPASLRPQQRMELLNIYLQTATEVIHASQGIIDKYLGNEIMILFNTQLNPDAHHARRAIEMAALMRKPFDTLAARLGGRMGGPQYSIAVHTGIATLGNVGSLRRRSFTAIGDTINLTKRIQESATAGQVLITGESLARASQNGPIPHLRFESRGAMQARGRQSQTDLYEVFHA